MEGPFPIQKRLPPKKLPPTKYVLTLCSTSPRLFCNSVVLSSFLLLLNVSQPKDFALLSLFLCPSVHILMDFPHGENPTKGLDASRSSLFSMTRKNQEARRRGRLLPGVLREVGQHQHEGGEEDVEVPEEAAEAAVRGPVDAERGRGRVLHGALHRRRVWNIGKEGLLPWWKTIYIPATVIGSLAPARAFFGCEKEAVVAGSIIISFGGRERPIIFSTPQRVSSLILDLQKGSTVPKLYLWKLRYRNHMNVLPMPWEYC